jgi:rhodanese-related sulfurtransferase
LLQQIRSGVPVLVIDVRDRSELIEGGAIAGARCFPFEQLGTRLGELSARHDTSVIVVSQDEQRSSAAAATLALAGFAEVAALEGGMKRWLALGFPVEDRGVESIRIRASIPSARR